MTDNTLLTIQETLALEISERKMYEALHFEALKREAKLREALESIAYPSIGRSQSDQRVALNALKRSE